ncbi:hypothetical protein JQR88_25650 (plasmid) [Pseudomonas luteola]|uniref:hypothetical protein n=1 Tax=Pseudomonas luteola TaxID=47886 RepID=UPI003D9FB3CC
MTINNMVSLSYKNLLFFLLNAIFYPYYSYGMENSEDIEHPWDVIGFTSCETYDNINMKVLCLKQAAAKNHQIFKLDLTNTKKGEK